MSFRLPMVPCLPTTMCGTVARGAAHCREPGAGRRVGGDADPCLRRCSCNAATAGRPGVTVLYTSISARTGQLLSSPCDGNDPPPIARPPDTGGVAHYDDLVIRRISLVILFSCAALLRAQPADTIFTNAKIVTVDPGFRI